MISCAIPLSLTPPLFLSPGSPLLRGAGQRRQDGHRGRSGRHLPAQAVWLDPRPHPDGGTGHQAERGTSASCGGGLENQWARGGSTLVLLRSFLPINPAHPQRSRRRSATCASVTPRFRSAWAARRRWKSLAASTSTSPSAGPATLRKFPWRLRVWAYVHLRRRKVNFLGTQCRALFMTWQGSSAKGSRRCGGGDGGGHIVVAGRGRDGQHRRDRVEPRGLV